MSSRELSSVFISITGIFNLEIILITFVMLISLLFFNFLMTKQRLSLVMKQSKSLILSGISYIFSPNSIIIDFFPNLLIRFSLFFNSRFKACYCACYRDNNFFYLFLICFFFLRYNKET